MAGATILRYAIRSISGAVKVTCFSLAALYVLIAQRVEQRTFKPWVKRSSRFKHTIKGYVFAIFRILGVLQMKIEYVKTAEIIPYANNPRINDGEAVDRVASSIKEYGFKNPIIIDKDNVIVAGHTRYKAAQKLNLDTVPTIRADDLTPAQIKAFRLADNKVAEYSSWDNELLSIELEELQELDFDLDLTGFEEFEIESLLNEDENEEKAGEYLDANRGTLQERFIVPPFSILDTRQGYWQDRKRIWKQIIKSDNGRDEELLGSGLRKLAEKNGADLTGTSIFDPVLCETLINWFCPKGGKVLDPFAGGSVRGLISVLLGNDYTGIDLSERQIKANIDNYKLIADRQDLYGNNLKRPNWINDDSYNIDILVKEKHDFLLTCPPYADLEVYSDDPRDISNMPYDKFIEAYNEIIIKAADKLKDNAFAAIVVGDVRNKKGYYHGFVPDTIEAFKKAGLNFYNECILIEQIATGAMRAGKQFEAGRKVVKTHQNVLIFVKGNEKDIMKDLNIYEYSFGEDSYNVESA